jgi:predicted transcriptional regulator
MQEKQPPPNKTTVYLPSDIRERLKHSAKQHRRSFNSELVWALQFYLEHQEKDKK